MKASPMKRLLALTAVLAISAACSGSVTSASATDDTDTDGTTTDGTTTTGTVAGTRGVLKTADGAPVAGAAVAITTTSASSSLSLVGHGLKNRHGRYVPLPQLTDSEGSTCDDLDLSGDVLATDCTAADGAYTLVADDIPCGSEVTFSAKKGSFFISFSITLNCSELDSDGDGDTTDETVALDDFEFSDDCGFSNDSSSIDDDSDADDSDDSTDDSDDDDSLSLVRSHPAYTTDEESCSFDIAEMAVVTGNYDDIQNVLAKLGYGEVTDFGELDMDQSFDFDLYDGTNELDDEEFDNFDELVNDPDALAQYDIIFINCGNNEEDLSTDPEVMANLQEYVENGGKLYVTDWSYMFIEQNYPSFMNFVDGGDDAEVAEDPITAAKLGTGGITSDATVEDETMAEWLDNVSVNEGDIEEDCFLEDEFANARDGARNEDGTVTIGDFLSAWVVMEGIHDGVTEEPTIWLSGPVTYSDPDSFGDSLEADVPLSATRAQGSGEILYSSYHTAHSCPTQGFWPQERVLQFLVFEL